MHDVTAFSEGIAQILANHDDDEHVRQLHLEWAIDHWVAIEMARYAPVFDECFAAMAGRVPLEYNDLDNYAQIVEWDGAQAVAHQDQNRNFVYVRKPLPDDNDSEMITTMNRVMGIASGEFHIYRYWIVPKDQEERDSHWQEWSDEPSGSYFPHNRPTLDLLIEQKGTTYNDSRDRAWIASIGKGLGTEGGMIYNYADFKSAIFSLGTLATAIIDGDTHADQRKGIQNANS